MLNALAMILTDKLFDLARVVLTFVQGDADRSIGCDHGLTEETRRLPLDIKEFLLLKIEEFAVEIAPYAHMSAPDIVRNVIKQVEPDIVRSLGFAPVWKLRPISIEVRTVLDEIEI